MLVNTDYLNHTSKDGRINCVTYKISDVAYKQHIVQVQLPTKPPFVEDLPMTLRFIAIINYYELFVLDINERLYLIYNGLQYISDFVHKSPSYVVKFAETYFSDTWSQYKNRINQLLMFR